MDLANVLRNLHISPLSIISAILLLLFGFLYFRLQRNVPPGPWGLPFLGLWPFLKSDDVHLQLQKYMKTYGDVYSFKYVGYLFIHIGSMKALKEAVGTKSDCFMDRNPDFNILTSLFGEGVIVTNGEQWKVLRKFFVNAFREHGLSSAKDYLSGPILDSVNSTVEDLRVRNGAPFDIVSVMTLRSSEILRRVLFNDYGLSEKELKSFIEEYEELSKVFARTNALLNGDFSRYFIFPFIKAYQTAKESQQKCMSILKKVIDEHESSFDKDNVRNIIDSYIKERNERRSKGDPTAEYFTESTLASSFLQFVGDGITAVVVFIAFFINALLEHPEEQEKIYKELEEVIGSDRQPTLGDKSKLPYFNAFIQEAQRKMDFLNLFANLMCTKETTLNGYSIPKGSILTLNIWACHRDPHAFEDPENFKPSRYIAGPGQRKADAPLSFGMGKRTCIGESFVMLQTFLFLATVIKNFRLTRPEGTTKKAWPDIVLEVCAYPRK